MILSSNQKLGEFEAIRVPQHIARVWESIASRLPQYWRAFAERELAKQPVAAASAVAQAFAAAVQEYEKTAKKYRDFFVPEAMEEFADDPGAFKSHLAKDVPIIARTLNQRRPELLEWQRDFRGARAKDLLAVFSNVLDFREEWANSQPESVFATHDDPAAFGLDPLDDDESMTLTNVIGMGIKSVVLHHLDSRIFPRRLRTDLYGLYFLSGMNDFGLASRSSEFLMINDRALASNGSMIMDHNFWYPYGLFSMYVLRIFRWLQAQVQSEGRGLDTQVRHVFVAHFLASVCAGHVEDMKTMRAHDRFEIPA
jgi:hypothetical protein